MTESKRGQQVERGLRLKELRIEASPLAKAPLGLVFKSKEDDPQRTVFRWSAHHVREIFVALLPKGFILDGSSVIQLDCGPRGNEAKYQRVPGSSRFFAEDFDFGRYATASPASRQEQVLETIETSLQQIALLNDKPDNAIPETGDRVRQAGFRLSLEVKKLKMKLPESGRSIHVFRHLSCENGENWTLREMMRGAAVREIPVGPPREFIDGRGKYQSAAIEGCDYVLRDRLDREWFRFLLS